jgi:hypothetical protein
MSILGIVALCIIGFVVVFVTFCYSVDYEETQKRKAGVLPACGWQYADSECRCYLEPRHAGRCRATNGREDWYWHGINYDYDRAAAGWVLSETGRRVSSPNR